MRLSRLVAAFAVLFGLTAASAVAAPGKSSPDQRMRFQNIQSQQLERIDAALAGGEVSFSCAAILYEEQRAIRGKFEHLASDGALSDDEQQVVDMMQSYAHYNINGRCLAAR